MITDPALQRHSRWLLFGCTLLLLFTGCSSSSRSVRFRINSEPEGSHVIYQIQGENLPCAGEWIYLGDTPLRSVRQFDEEAIESADKIILKVFHSGYHDQAMEWDGDQFWEEIGERGEIFWTPELIPGDSP